MKTELYTITTLTNMHVGSGDINFNIIDKQVQRDSISGLPVIHSSSLKGAFRENLKTEDDKETNMTAYIFGPENGDDSSHKTGAFSFFEAQLLTRPVRSSKKPYFSASSPEVIQNFLNTIKEFEIDFDEELKTTLIDLSKLTPQVGRPMIFESINDAILEDYTAISDSFDVSSLTELLGDNIALFHHDDYKKLELPVLARNSLEDGVSENLWYEEVVPKSSKFFFAMAKPTNHDEADKPKLERFEKSFENGSRRVQIGANKSIGYGFSNVQKVSKWVKKI